MTKPYKRSAKLQGLMEQGAWIEGEIEGQKVLYFLMPTTRLQEELDEAIETAIKKYLKLNDWERVCATERRHPFHSDVLRERIDGRDRAYLTEENTKQTRRNLMRQVSYSSKHDTYKPGSIGSIVPFSKEDVELIVERGVKEARQHWAASYNEWADFQRNPTFYRGTYVERMFCPEGEPPIPDGPRPKPVFISKQTPDIVICVAGGFVNLWTTPSQMASI